MPRFKGSCSSNSPFSFMPKCLQMSLHFGGIQQSQTASSSDRLFSYCACVAFLVSTRFSEYPSHREVNSIQLLHPACSPSSMLYPATKICPFLWRCLLFSLQFFLSVDGTPFVAIFTAVFSCLNNFMGSGVGAKHYGCLYEPCFFCK